SSLAVGASVQFHATGSYSDGSTREITATVTWASSSTSVATITNSGTKGVATGVAAGSTTISATLSGVSGSTPLTVTQPAPTLSSITVAPATASVDVGGTQAFSATAHYSDGTTANVSAQVTWASSDIGVATVSGSGLATAKSAGSATISATMSGKSGSASLTVTAPAPTLTSVTVAPATASL